MILFMTDLAVSNGNLYIATSNALIYKVSPVNVSLSSPKPDLTAILDAASLKPAGMSPGKSFPLSGIILVRLRPQRSRSAAMDG